MTTQSDLFEIVLASKDLLSVLRPSQPSDFPLLFRIREATDAELRGEREVRSPDLFPLLRCGLLYAVDAIDEAHKLAQAVPSDEGSYWHGMIHRREGDFENARYWFRRAGTLSCFDDIQAEAARISATFAAQFGWEPYLMTGECEQERFGAEELRESLVALQRLEFRILLNHTLHMTLK